MGWAVGWEFLQRMSGKWGPVRKHRGGTVGSGLFAEKAASTQPMVSGNFIRCYCRSVI